MKRRILLVCVALGAMLSAMAQRSYTFNAVALNVDGLPVTIDGIEINPDGKGAAGATELCEKIANSGWDFVGFSEDFNFHSQLTAAPASTYYNFGAHGGGVSGLSNSTDGLGFACAKYLTMSGGTRVEWGNYNGTIDQGADGLINKGFRVYTVTFATGVAVDVYVLHMDASDGAQDIAARETQLTKLATYIKNNHNNRPVIIMGDTNCRYTREQLKTKFIDVINADSRLTINDPWVDLMWGGAYPSYGSDAMMTHTYGEQKGEIVDKVLYINTTASNLKLKANSYLHDMSIDVSDHNPVVVNFTLTDPNGTPTDNSSWQVNGGVIVENENMLDGCKVTDGTTYFIKNVSTGLYLKSGATWGTQACEGSAGMPITVTLSNGKYKLGTLNGSMSAVEKPYMDNGDNTTWTLQEVANTKYQYYLKISDTKALSSTGETANVVYCKNFDAGDDKQKWILLTEERMKEEMANATASDPFDITPLLKAASFDRMDLDFSDNASTNWPNLSFTLAYNDDASTHNGYAYYNNTEALTVSQTLKSMPAGTYAVSFEGFYRARADYWSIYTYKTKDYDMTIPVSFGEGSVNLKKNTSLGIGGDAQATFRDADSYIHTIEVTTNAQGNMTLKVAKPKFSDGSKNRTSWIALDNFVIKYKGDGSEQENVLSIKSLVGNYINMTAQKVAQLNAAGQAAYDITNIIYRYNNDLLSSDGQAEIAMIDAAYEAALIAHKNALIEEALNGNGDVTILITNPSFETGDETGWNVDDATMYLDINFDKNDNVDGKDGVHRFNAWCAAPGVPAVKQTVKGLKNGLYELSALVASDYGNVVYIIANGSHAGKAATNAATFVEVTLPFLVEDGTATIGAVGGVNGHYFPKGCWYKADNFRLKYICDAPHGRLKLALDEVAVAGATLDAYGQAEFDISEYQTMYDNKSLTTDGTAEAAAVRAALQVAAKAQRTKNANMTWAITNPSFETGDYRGWTTTEGWDAGTRSQDNATYAVVGADGNYLYNIWIDGVGGPMSQSITGIPNGTYRLTAMLASDKANTIKLTANGVSTTTTGTEPITYLDSEGNTLYSIESKSVGVEKSVDCQVTNGTLNISVEGENNAWYKCDDFHLTYLGHELKLSENETVGTIDDWYTSVTVARTIKHNTWSTFVVPFDMAIPAGWEVKELTSSVYANDKITLTFKDAANIEAGVAYMVRVGSDVSNLPTIENVQVTNKLDNPSTSHVEFVGVYNPGKIPAGAFFISDNVFYQADETNTIKAFRAYFQPKTANARALNYRFDGEEGTTGIEEATEEVTIVGIYTLGGVRINDMQEGVNILKMSDGTTMKVIIK